MPFDAVVPPPPPASFRPPPQPVEVGTLVSRTFAVWSKHVWLFAGFFAVAVMLPAFVVGMIAALAVGAGTSEGGLQGGSSTAILVTTVSVGFPLILVAAFVNMGGLTYGAIQGLAGRPVAFGTMFSVGFRRLLPMIVAGIVIGLAVGLGFLLLIVPGVILGCGLAAAMPVVVAEKMGPLDAIRRSWELTSGSRGTIFLTGLIFVLINLGLTLVGIVLGLIPILGQLASLIINVVTGSLGTIWLAVVYHDLRVAKEGVETDDLARVFE